MVHLSQCGNHDYSDYDGYSMATCLDLKTVIGNDRVPSWSEDQFFLEPGAFPARKCRRGVPGASRWNPTWRLQRSPAWLVEIQAEPSEAMVKAGSRLTKYLFSTGFRRDPVVLSKYL